MVRAAGRDDRDGGARRTQQRRGRHAQVQRRRDRLVPLHSDRAQDDMRCHRGGRGGGGRRRAVLGRQLKRRRRLPAVPGRPRPRRRSYRGHRLLATTQVHLHFFHFDVHIHGGMPRGAGQVRQCHSYSYSRSCIYVCIYISVSATVHSPVPAEETGDMTSVEGIQCGRTISIQEVPGVSSTYIMNIIYRLPNCPLNNQGKDWTRTVDRDRQ